MSSLEPVRKDVPRKRIVFADDDPRARELFGGLMRGWGYEVVEARSGREAVELADSRHPDIVVMDISMPGMDGIEAMHKILEVHFRLPVVLYTAYASYKDNFLSWSADRYVIKTDDGETLKKALDGIVARLDRGEPVGVF